MFFLFLLRKIVHQLVEVAEDLVPKILATTGNGKSVEFLTTDKVLI